MFYTYILQCADNTLYTGWTTDPEKRIATHNEGAGSKYTRTRLPVKLVAHWCFPTKQEAMRAEYHIKTLTKSQKLAVIQTFPHPSDTGFLP